MSTWFCLSQFFLLVVSTAYVVSVRNANRRILTLLFEDKKDFHNLFNRLEYLEGEMKKLYIYMDDKK